jgi:sporulation protein YlmC with PRC-barrel domain
MSLVAVVSEVVQIDLGATVRCTDGVLGELADVVIDPVKKRVTHLVAEPEQGHREARLVPVELAKGGAEHEIEIDCTVDEARKFPTVQEFAYLRLGQFAIEDPNWDVGVAEVLAMPYYEAGFSPGNYMEDSGVVYDRIPKGEVEIRRASAVNSTDGDHLGHVDGFVVDGEQITHLVLERGHLWGKRDIAIPIGAVADVLTDAVTLKLSKDEVGALADLPLRRWAD